jgi:hypothetical protein
MRDTKQWVKCLGYMVLLLLVVLAGYAMLFRGVYITALGEAWQGLTNIGAAFGFSAAAAEIHKRGDVEWSKLEELP